MKRNRILAVSCALALLALIGSQTLANDTESFTTTNVITTGDVSMEIYETTLVEIASAEIPTYEANGYNVETMDGKHYVEKGYDEQYYDATTGNSMEILPGDTISKIVYAENTGSEPFYTRIQVEVTGMEEDDSLVFDMSEDWVAGATVDGATWYYYDGEVDADEVLTFFETVKFPTTMDDAYLLADADSITISVTGEAVQESHTTQEHLGTYLGWEVVTMAPEKIADNVDGGDS